MKLILSLLSATLPFFSHANSLSVRAFAETLNTSGCRYFSSAETEVGLLVKGDTKDLGVSMTFEDAFSFHPPEVRTLEVQESTREGLFYTDRFISHERGQRAYQVLVVYLSKTTQTDEQSTVETDMRRYRLPPMSCESNGLIELDEIE